MLLKNKSMNKKILIALLLAIFIGLPFLMSPILYNKLKVKTIDATIIEALGAAEEKNPFILYYLVEIDSEKAIINTGIHNKRGFEKYAELSSGDKIQFIPSSKPSDYDGKKLYHASDNIKELGDLYFSSEISIIKDLFIGTRNAVLFPWYLIAPVSPDDASTKDKVAVIIFTIGLIFIVRFAIKNRRDWQKIIIAIFIILILSQLLELYFVADRVNSYSNYLIRLLV